MKIINEKCQSVPIDSIKPHPKNPNVGNEEVIAESINTSGFYGAVIVQKSTGMILAGEHRWKVAKSLGATEVPVMYVDCDDATAEKILVADNRTNELSSFDPAGLSDLLEGMDSLIGTGFVAEDLQPPGIRDVSIKAPPKMTWVLLGIPTVRYGDIAGAVEIASAAEGVIFQTTHNDEENRQ